jgi:hypothetical protein
MRRPTFLLLLLFLSLSVVTCFSQQNYISKYSGYGGFSYLSTPSLNSVQRGFDSDFGVNLRSWLTVGADFSYGSGSTTLLPNQLNAATQAKLLPYLPVFQKYGIPLAVPYDSSTYTYEAGPQFNYRRLRKLTLFARPALGALHTTITAKPNNPMIAQLVSGLLGGKMSQSDTVLFYGFGGGMTWEATHQFGIRATVDFVHYNMFSDILDGGRNTVRVTVGTKFNFGKNILGK